MIGNASWQAEQSATKRHHIVSHFRQTEFRALGSDDEIAGQCKLKTAADGETFDCRDHRLAWRCAEKTKAAALRGSAPFAARSRLQVRAGRERAAGTGDDRNE